MMPWTFGGAAGALLLLAGASVVLAGSAASPERAAQRADYRRPVAIPFPETNPYSRAKASLGRTLFFDPILSGPKTRSCASCHVPALSWSDGLARAAALGEGEMQQRTPTLIDIAWIDRLGWDGKFKDLESVAFRPITSKVIMDLTEAELVARLSADPAYVKAFAEAFPEAGRPADAAAGEDPPAAVERPITRGRVEDALATFERLLVAAPAPFDRWIAGDEAAIPAAAKRGFDLFNGKARCAACHGGSSFSDGSFHDIGSAKGNDIGRGRYFPGSQALLYAFKTPTLRNVAERAPYMHDGSEPTLAAVIDLYDRGGIDRPSRSRDIRPLHLSVQEKTDLLAFLETLTGPSEPHPALGDLGTVPATP